MIKANDYELFQFPYLYSTVTTKGVCLHLSVCKSYALEIKPCNANVYEKLLLKLVWLKKKTNT